MKCEEIIDLILSSEFSELSKDEQKTIELYLASNEACAKSVEEVILLLKTLNSVEEETPSSNLKIQFNELLANEIEKESTKIVALEPRNHWKNYLKIAASIALLVSGFVLGKYSNDNSQHQQQTALLALLENQSASQRILAVTELQYLNDKDNKIINALINKLLLDENVNVRLTACEALVRFSSSIIVRDAFIKALETEKEPILQIELIQILANLQEKRALVPMQHLFENDETPNYVKQQLTYNMPSLI